MSSQEQENLEKLADLLNRVAGKDPGIISRSSRLQEDIGLESLEMMELLFEAEEEFKLKIEVPTETLSRVKTVGDLLDALLPEG